MRKTLGNMKRQLRRLLSGSGNVEPQVDVVPQESPLSESDAQGIHYDDTEKSDETRARIAALTQLNFDSQRPVNDPANAVVVSVTTHGPRLGRAHLALEAIAQGTERPARLVLALSDSDASGSLSPELERLVQRGLEIVVVPDRYRVHSKYMGVVASAATTSQPVVVADDDQLYPEWWLARLLETQREFPGAVIAHRAHQLLCESDTTIAPYRLWQPRISTAPALAAFGTGVSGMLLPVKLVNVLASGGEEFLRHAPTADDIWLHSRAVEHGIMTVQVGEYPANFEFVPGTQHVGLYLVNVFENANDPQIANSYSSEAISVMYADQNRENLHIK